MGETAFVSCAICLEGLSQILGLWLWVPGGAGQHLEVIRSHGQSNLSTHLCTGQRQPGSSAPGR